MQHAEGSFAEIAVALALASSKLKLDMAKTKMIADRIGLSRMGYELIVPQLERDIELVEQALALFKEMSTIEPQVRAVIDRKIRRSWLPSFAKVAAV